MPSELRAPAPADQAALAPLPVARPRPQAKRKERIVGPLTHAAGDLEHGQHVVFLTSSAASLGIPNVAVAKLRALSEAHR